MLNRFFQLIGFICVCYRCAAELSLNSDAGNFAQPNSLCPYASDVFTYSGAGVKQSCVKAVSSNEWIYFSLNDASQQYPNDPQNSATWDIAFQRFKIKINGGVSGSGNGAVSAISGADNFDSSTQAASGGYRQDSNFAQGDNFDDACFTSDGVNYALLDNFSAANQCWFTYNSTNHVLTTANLFYFLRANNGSSYYKIKFTSYYSESGSSAYPRFSWQAVAAP